MKIIKNMIQFIITILLFLSFSIINYAAEDGIGFEVRPLLPGTQFDTELGYYYVQTEPGVKQTFNMSIFSTSDKEKRVEIIIENAISSNSGSISYSKDLKQIDSSLKNPITEIVKPETNEIVLKPREEKNVSFELSPPKNSYSGLKMGRIIIKEKKDENKKGISQDFQYGVGIITSESGDPFNDGNVLKLNEVKPTVLRGSKVISGEIVNPEPKTIENLKVRSYVTKKGDSKKIKQKNIDNFSFAPNSKLDFTIPWGLTNFKPGDYTFHFEAKNNYDSFHLKKDFNIKPKDANSLNEEVAFKVNTPNYIKIIIIFINILLLLLFIIIMLRNNKWKHEIKRRQRKRKKDRKK